MIVYVDLVFLTNLAVDGTVLLATAKARRLKPRRWRIAASAVLGASYASALFIADVPALYTLAAKLIVSLLMLLLAFGYGGPLAFLRSLGVFYTVNFVTLGGVIGLHSLIRYSGSSWSGMTMTRGGGIVLDWRMQSGLFAASVILSILLYRGTAESRKKQEDTAALLWTVEIVIDGEHWPIAALLDTGNRLYDPISRVPVMIMEATIWRDKLPAGWCERLQAESADKLLSELDDSGLESFPWISRLRLIPYRGVNGGSRLMLALKPDAVTMSRDDRSPIRTARVLIGLDGGTLSPDGTYRAILHPQLIENGAAAPAPSQPA